MSLGQLNMCIVRSGLEKILHCAGVLVVSRDEVAQTRVLTSGSIWKNKDGI